MKRVTYILSLMTLTVAVNTTFTSCSNVADVVEEIVSSSTDVASGIDVCDFPVFGDDQTRATDVAGTATGKTAWETDDKIYLQINGGNWYTLKYDGSNWCFDGDRIKETTITSYRAVYAPNYSVNNYKLVLSDGSTSSEFLEGSGTGNKIKITFEKRKYSRIRIYTAARTKYDNWQDYTINVIFDDGFTASDGSDKKSFSAKPDRAGNIYVYGSWTKDAIIKVQTPKLSKTQSGFSEPYLTIGLLHAGKKVAGASVGNKAYAIDNGWILYNLDNSNADLPLTYFGTYRDNEIYKLKVIGTCSESGDKTNFPALDGFTELTIADCSEVKGLTHVPDNAFRNSWSAKIILPENNTITHVGVAAFNNCYAFTGYKMPYLVDVDNYAFGGCNQMTNFELPSTLKTVGSCGFSDCVFEASELPDGLKTIGHYGFGGCKNISFSTLPSSVETVDDGAFSNTQKITKFFWPKTTKRIPGTVFAGCASPIELTIEEGVEEIGDHAFENSDCGAIVLPSTINKIGAYAFYKYQKLTSSFAIPEKVTSIGEYAFYQCPDFNAKLPSILTYIGNYAFAGCSDLKDVTIPSNLQYLGNYAFQDCVNIVSDITLPSTLTTFGDGAFYQCKGLTNVTIEPNSNIDYIPKSAFEKCTGIKELTIPEGVKEIKVYAFANLDALTNLVLPSTLTLMHNWAFYQSIKLATATCYATEPPEMPSSTSEYRGWYCYQFWDCPSDAKLYVPKGCVDAYKAVGGWAQSFADKQRQILELED